MANSPSEPRKIQHLTWLLVKALVIDWNLCGGGFNREWGGEMRHYLQYISSWWPIEVIVSPMNYCAPLTFNCNVCRTTVLVTISGEFLHVYIQTRVPCPSLPRCISDLAQFLFSPEQLLIVSEVVARWGLKEYFPNITKSLILKLQL